MPYSRVKKFIVTKSFETYGGLIPLASKISMPSFVILRFYAAEQCCLKILKIQQRGYPRKILQSVQKLNPFQNQLIRGKFHAHFISENRFSLPALVLLQ